MKIFQIDRTTYKGKLPMITFMYNGYKGLDRGLCLQWNIRPINERCHCKDC